MANDYKTRYSNMLEEIQAPKILEYSRLEDNPNSFSRKRKMPVDDLIISVLSRKGLTTAMDIFDYYEEKKTNDAISKQAYLKQRKKLNYRVFTHLNQSYLINFYRNLTSEDLFHGFLVMAVDGSKAEVPASDENRKQFGERNREKGTIRALVNCITDVFHQFTLAMQLGSIYDSESELALLNIQAAKEIVGEIPLLLLFDRGYPGIELMNCLDKAGIKYVFRLASNDYKNERSKMTKPDETVKLEHTRPRLAKIRKKRPEAAVWLSTMDYTETRIILASTPSEKGIAFATNLFNELESEEVVNLYFNRWKIEEGYNTLKNKLKFESVTGEAAIYVYQDFWAQVLVYNMVQDILNSSNAELLKKTEMDEYKYPIHANENMAVGLFKRAIIGIMLEGNPNIREKKMIKLQKTIEKYTLPYRQCKGHET
ncbi:IS4 family transposase [Macellibacteroides fermentans]|uniref:IS4 family transposase n=1 Tax=Macellibacteroides fermentans TaxID=879969 RepID=UPI00406BEF99